MIITSDSHYCYFKLGSFSYDASLVTFTLDQLGFDLSNQVSLLDYSPQGDQIFTKWQVTISLKFLITGDFCPV